VVGRNKCPELTGKRRSVRVHIVRIYGYVAVHENE
jgi:hypothetical protein